MSKKHIAIMFLKGRGQTPSSCMGEYLEHSQSTLDMASHETCELSVEKHSLKDTRNNPLMDIGRGNKVVIAKHLRFVSKNDFPERIGWFLIERLPFEVRCLYAGKNLAISFGFQQGDAEILVATNRATIMVDQ